MTSETIETIKIDQNLTKGLNMDSVNKIKFSALGHEIDKFAIRTSQLLNIIYNPMRDEKTNTNFTNLMKSRYINWTNPNMSARSCSNILHYTMYHGTNNMIDAMMTKLQSLNMFDVREMISVINGIKHTTIPVILYIIHKKQHDTNRVTKLMSILKHFIENIRNGLIPNAPICTESLQYINDIDIMCDVYSLFNTNDNILVFSLKYCNNDMLNKLINYDNGDVNMVLGESDYRLLYRIESADTFVSVCYVSSIPKHDIMIVALYNLKDATCREFMEKYPNLCDYGYTDDDGNCILYICILRRLIQTIKFITDQWGVTMNRVNKNGVSILDVPKQLKYNNKSNSKKDILWYQHMCKKVVF